MRLLPIVFALVLAACSASPTPPATATPSDSQDSAATSAEADRTFVQALQAGDRAAALALVDDDATWTDANGNTLTKPGLGDMFPTPAIGDETPAEARAFDYGQVAVIRIDRGRMHALRVWAQRPAGWRLLLYQEVESLATPPVSVPPGIGHECVNPCKTVPYEPTTDSQRGVIAAFQALEIASHAADTENWGRHVADEFVLVSSNGDRVIDKVSRLEGFRKASYGGVSPSALVSAQLFDFGPTVVMRALHQPATGRPLQVGRVWVLRDGTWMSVLSYQTAIRSAPALTN